MSVSFTRDAEAAAVSTSLLSCVAEAKRRNIAIAMARRSTASSALLRGNQQCSCGGAVRHHRLVRVTLRRGTDNDAEAVTELYLRSREAAIGAIPAMVHTQEETRSWIAREVVPQTDLWVAEDDGGAVVGMLVLDNEWVDQLYVEPALTGQGIGGELIELAKQERPSGLRLWTFESNVRAQRFYERNGFSARDRTTGDNEEGAPDILYVWDGVEP